MNIKTVFNRVETNIRVDTLVNIVTGVSNYIKLPVLDSTYHDETLIRDILIGVHKVSFDAIETKIGLEFSLEHDFKYMSAIANFYFNSYTVDGYYFRDLTGYEHNIFENIEVQAFTLRLPYSEEDIFNFKTRTR